MNALIVQAIAWCQFCANYDRRLLGMDYAKMPLNFASIQNKVDYVP